MAALAPHEGHAREEAKAAIPDPYLGLRIEMWDALFPLAPLNHDDNCSGLQVYPPGAGCRIFLFYAESPVYCRIKALGTLDKGAVRGSLQSQNEDGTWFGSVEAR